MLRLYTYGLLELIKKYTEFYGAALNVNILRVTLQKTAFRKDNKVENKYCDKVTALSHVGELY